MTLEKALNISPEEFADFAKQCNGFNNEIYKNHVICRDQESFGEFLKKGSLLISKNLEIKGNLGDDNND